MTKYLEELLKRTTETEYPLGDGHVNKFEHVFTFFSIALQIKAKKILELGVRDGGSTYPFLVACKALNAQLTSIDIVPLIGSMPEDLKSNWTFIQSDAIKFLEDNTESYDLVYVDDWHSYPHVKKELELINKFATPNTIILLHDLMGNSWPQYHSTLSAPADSEWGEGGPYRAVSELDPEVWEWMTIPVSHGMTLLRKKATIKLS